jgi:hypothetical protein
LRKKKLRLNQEPWELQPPLDHPHSSSPRPWRRLSAPVYCARFNSQQRLADHDTDWLRYQQLSSLGFGAEWRKRRSLSFFLSAEVALVGGRCLACAWLRNLIGAGSEITKGTHWGSSCFACPLSISMTRRERRLSSWHEKDARVFCRHGGLVFIIARSLEVFFRIYLGMNDRRTVMQQTSKAPWLARTLRRVKPLITIEGRASVALEPIQKAFAPRES